VKVVNSIDLNSVVKAVAKEKLLKPSDLSVGEELYRVFLFLRKRYPKLRLVPHPMADIFWHQHILQTRKYHADCKKIFGKYLHHEPGTSATAQQLKLAKKKTIELVKKHFLE